MPLRQLLVHDLSKLTPHEYLPSVRYEQATRRLTPEERAVCDAALELHHRRNPHHPEHWLRRTPGGEFTPIPMPDRYRQEMLADWRAVGRTKNQPTRTWYLERFDALPLHSETKAWVERELRVQK